MICSGGGVDCSAALGVMLSGGLEDLGEAGENLNDGRSVFGLPLNGVEGGFDCCCSDGKKAENEFGGLLNEGVGLSVGGNTVGARSNELVFWASAGLKEIGGCVAGCFDGGKNWKGVVDGFDS